MIRDGVSRGVIARIVATSFLVGIACFFGFSLWSYALVGAEATRALNEWASQAYEPIEQQWLNVREISTSDVWNSRSGYLIDDAVIAAYESGLNSGSRFSPYEVHHLSDGVYDAFFMGTGKTLSDGGSEVLYVNTTFERMVRWVSSATVGVIAGISALLVGISRARYKVKRDKKDARMESLFANAAHELKNPLAAIQGYADAAASEAMSVNEAAERIAYVSGKMNTTIGEILDIGRLDADALRPKLERWDIREIVFDAATLVEADCAAAGIVIEMRLPNSLARYCDESMLFTVFSNVLANAKRHAKSRIVISEGASAKGRVEILFENDGKPPADEDLPFVFERFYKGSGGESGIGLALSKEYLDLLGGSIEVVPFERGTLVRVEI